MYLDKLADSTRKTLSTGRAFAHFDARDDKSGKNKESNWLPSPDGPIYLVMRLYWPKEKAPSILNGTWAPPKVEKVN